VIFGLEPVISLHRNDVRAQLARIAYQCAVLMPKALAA
jgi:hypothetical protein